MTFEQAEFADGALFGGTRTIDDAAHPGGATFGSATTPALPFSRILCGVVQAKIAVVPANEVPWQDLDLVVGQAKWHGRPCYCQRFKLGEPGWRSTTGEERAHRFREETDCGHPESPSTSGLVAYADGEPAGWCSVEPRPRFPHLPGARVAWKKRGEDKDDAEVWAVTCFVVRAGFRRTGISRALAAAAVEFARGRGARAVEGYAMVTEPGKEITWGELHVGSRSVFAAAGLREVARPTPRRVIMRRDF